MGKRGDEILHRMEDLGLEPDDIFLSLLIHCWKESEDSGLRKKRLVDLQTLLSD